MNPAKAPGGALVREIEEELQCTIVVGDEINTAEHEYDFAFISLTTFYCELVEGDPSLTEHEAVVWLSPAEIKSLDWAPADLPAVDSIFEKLTS